MSEWLDSQKKPASNFLKLLQERIEKANPRRNLTAVEAKRLAKLVDFPGFARHLIALKCNSIGDVYDQQAVHRRIQNRSG